MRLDGNDDAIVENHIVYDSFGNIESQTDDTETIGSFYYTGQEFDAETGLYYYNARYYDANTGRFISQDPMGFDAGDTNLYRYVGNNPMTFTDPTGMCTSAYTGMMAAATSFALNPSGMAIPSMAYSSGVSLSGANTSGLAINFGGIPITLTSSQRDNGLGYTSNSSSVNINFGIGSVTATNWWGGGPDNAVASSGSSFGYSGYGFGQPSSQIAASQPGYGGESPVPSEISQDPLLNKMYQFGNEMEQMSRETGVTSATSTSIDRHLNRILDNIGNSASKTADLSQSLTSVANVSNWLGTVSGGLQNSTYYLGDAAWNAGAEIYSGYNEGKNYWSNSDFSMSDITHGLGTWSQHEMFVQTYGLTQRGMVSNALTKGFGSVPLVGAGTSLADSFLYSMDMYYESDPYIKEFYRQKRNESGTISFLNMSAFTASSIGAARQMRNANNLQQETVQATLREEARGGTYVLRDTNGQIVRVGRTNNLPRRQAEHARDPLLKDYDFEPFYRTDTYNQQRGLEQLLYDTYNPPLNKIRPISPNNPNIRNYLNAAQEYLK